MGLGRGLRGLRGLRPLPAAGVGGEHVVCVSVRGQDRAALPGKVSFQRLRQLGGQGVEGVGVRGCESAQGWTGFFQAGQPAHLQDRERARWGWGAWK